MKRGAATLLVLASLASPLTVRAQVAHDSVAAEAAFAEARALMGQGRFAEACPKLEASYQLEPAVGTLLNLGDCFERVGRTASAWIRFRDAAAMAATQGQREREGVARQRAAALEPRLCRLVIKEGARPRADLAVTRDGAPVARAALGIPVPVDPGAHTVEATAPGSSPFAAQIEVRPPGGGGACPTAVVEIPELAPGAGAGGTGGAAAAAPALKPIDLGPEPPPRSAPPSSASPDAGSSAGSSGGGGWRTIHTLAVVSAAGGLVGLGLGTAFALDGSSTQSDADARCTSAGCTPEGKALLADAGASADVATVGFITGAALLATGAVLWIASPSLRAGSSRTQSRPAPGSAHAALRW